MSRTFLVAFAVLILVGVPRQVEAWSRFGECHIENGDLVPLIPASIQDVAKATRRRDGSLAIYYNPRIASLFSQSAQKFFFYHECAHQVLGHTLGGFDPLVAEQQADCWAIIKLVRSGQFGSRDVEAVQDELTRFGRKDLTHLSGRQRAINLMACPGYVAPKPPPIFSR